MLHNSRILVHHLSYHLSNGKNLLKDLTLTFLAHKIGLVGRNGIGKSTLMKIIIDEYQPSSGTIEVHGKLAYVSQDIVVAPDSTIAAILGFEKKRAAYQKILSGSAQESDYVIFQDDWGFEKRLQNQLAIFDLESMPHDRPISTLSGGELTRLMLIKAFHSGAHFLLLDEPTNHLDKIGRIQLYEMIKQWQDGLLIISHDRRLLNLMEEIVELSSLGANSYGGNYDAYTSQKELDKAAKIQQLHDAKKEILKAKKSIQVSREKHEQKQAYGQKLRKSGATDKLSANAAKGRSEHSQSKMLIKEERMQENAHNALQAAKEKIEIIEIIQVKLPETKVPMGKMILNIEDLSFSYAEMAEPLIKHFNLKMHGPMHLALEGDNGSGKTTLIKLILGFLKPNQGKIELGTQHIAYLDQTASLLYPECTVLENFMRLNPEANENEAYQALAKFLFKNVSALKQVKNLSSGEKLRALLACILMAKYPPQLLILDEPTNHLDICSVTSIETALNAYQGAMIVISHDQQFLENIGVEEIIRAPFKKIIQCA